MKSSSPIRDESSWYWTWTGILFAVLLSSLLSPNAFAQNGTEVFPHDRPDLRCEVQEKVKAKKSKKKSKAKMDIILANYDGAALLGKTNWTLTKAKKVVTKLKEKITLSKARGLSAKVKKLKKKLKDIKRNIIRTLKRCKKQYQDGDYGTDPGSGGDDGGGNGNGPDLWPQVQAILQTNCMSCHTSRGWTNSQEFFTATSRVVPGDPESSSLYASLAGNPEGYSPGNMPRDLGPIPSADIDTIRQWILSLGSGGSGSGFAFACNPQNDMSVSPLKRLTKEQLRNVVLDLLAPLGPSDQINAFIDLSNHLEGMPNDTPQRRFLEEFAFPGTDGTINSSHISALHRIISRFSAEVVETPERRLAFSLGNCEFASSGSGRVCLENFITQFGLKVHRRPLSTTEIADLIAFYESRQEEYAYADLVATMMLSPNFYLHNEVYGTEVAGRSDLIQLDAYALASRLSFLYWQSMPDDELFAAAADGSLLTESGYRAQLERVFQHERTRHTITEFFGELLGFNEIPPINAGDTPAFASFAAGENIPVGGSNVTQAARQELEDLLHHYIWTANASYSEMFMSTHSFARDQSLADLYGVPVWDGSEENLVPLPNGQVRGLLGRALMQLTGTHLKAPAKLGAKIVREWACLELSDPPDDIMDMVMPPAYDPTKSTRQRYEDLTAPVQCSGCHSQINPAGFAMENFDSIGRHRTDEKVFDEAGNEVNVFPINNSATIPLLPNQSYDISGPAELFQAIVDSGKAEACLIQQFFRFSHRQHEDLVADGCYLEGLRQTVSQGGSTMQDLFKGFALRDEFKRRRVGAP